MTAVSTKPDNAPVFEPPPGTRPSVLIWYRIHRKEGVPNRLAFYRAIERALADGELSDAAADDLEGALRDAGGRLDLG